MQLGNYSCKAAVMPLHLTISRPSSRRYAPPPPPPRAPTTGHTSAAAARRASRSSCGRTSSAPTAATGSSTSRAPRPSAPPCTWPSEDDALQRGGRPGQAHPARPAAGAPAAGPARPEPPAPPTAPTTRPRVRGSWRTSPSRGGGSGAGAVVPRPRPRRPEAAAQTRRPALWGRGQSLLEVVVAGGGSRLLVTDAYVWSVNLAGAPLRGAWAGSA